MARANETRAQEKARIAQEFRMRQEVELHRKLAREVLWPALAHTSNLSEAQQVCELMQNIIEVAMQKPYADAMISLLKLDEELTKDKDAKEKFPTTYPAFEALIENLKDVKIKDAMKILSGMGGAIDGFVRGKGREIKFVDLKPEDLIQGA